jgi:hypothetical protein
MSDSPIMTAWFPNEWHMHTGTAIPVFGTAVIFIYERSGMVA